MPRRHKNKSHARGKCHQVQGDTQEAQASAAAAPKEECPSSPSSAPQGSPLSSPAAGDRQELQGAMAPSSPDAGPSCAGSDEGAQGPEEESAGASQAAPATQSTRKDPLARKARILVEFLLEKYTKKEPITQNALMKIVSRKYRQHFPEILSTACERLELVFGLEMKEVDRSRNIYTLISKLNLGGNDCPSGEVGLPKSGLLMVLLGVIFMNGNRATEEEIWEFLSMLGIYAGRRHWIFGEPRRLITKDLVQKEYLNYRQVPNSDPPRYEFLWGRRACAETSKMKVLEVLAKFHGRVPSSFPDLYDEALREQAERAGLRGAARDPTMADACAPSKAKSRSSSHI
ncbi:hypothetical protein K5549_015631 [Capra hircus]|nr:hypothetical protein K5549_015631 [Capra hircus]